MVSSCRSREEGVVKGNSQTAEGVSSVGALVNGNAPFFPASKII